MFLAQSAKRPPPEPSPDLVTLLLHYLLYRRFWPHQLSVVTWRLDILIQIMHLCLQTKYARWLLAPHANSVLRILSLPQLLLWSQESSPLTLLTLWMNCTWGCVLLSFKTFCFLTLRFMQTIWFKFSASCQNQIHSVCGLCICTVQWKAGQDAFSEALLLCL